MRYNPTTPPADDDIPGSEPIELQEIRVLRLQPGDIGVLIHPEKLTLEARQRLQAEWERHFPNNRVMVLCEGMQFAIIKPGEDA